MLEQTSSRRGFLTGVAAIAGAVAAAQIVPGLVEAAPASGSRSVAKPAKAATPAVGDVAASASAVKPAKAAKPVQIGTLTSPSLGTQKVFAPILDPKSPRTDPYVDRLIDPKSLNAPGAVALQSKVDNNPLPGQLGVAVVAGHRTSHARPFKKLDKVKVGETIVYTDLATGQQTAYVVKELAVLSDKKADYLASFHEVHDNAVKYGSDTRLNLYACTRSPRRGRPWRTSTTGATLDARATSTTYRLAVFAAKV